MAFKQQLNLFCYASYEGDMEVSPTVFLEHSTTASTPHLYAY